MRAGNEGDSNEVGGSPFITGEGASRGRVTGLVVVADDPTDAANKMGLIDGPVILVTSMTNPAWLPVMIRARGVVTNSGGRLSHAAIVCREWGIPCIVGTRNATERLRDRTRITIDGLSGEIWKDE